MPNERRILPLQLEYEDFCYSSILIDIFSVSRILEAPMVIVRVAEYEQDQVDRNRL